ADGLLEVGVYCVVKGERRNFNLLDFELRMKVLDGANDFLDLRMPKFESLDHSIFADFERAGLHYYDGFFGRRDDDIQRAGLLLGNRRVGNELPIEQADANGGDRGGKRQVRAIRGRSSSSDGNDIRVVFAVCSKNQRVDLGFIAPRFREERAHRSVNQARDEDFTLGRTAFALEEAAGNLARGIGVLAIVNGQGEKVFVIRLWRHDGGIENYCVAIFGNNGSIGLLCDLGRFENERPAANFHRLLEGRWNVIICHDLYPLSPALRDFSKNKCFNPMPYPKDKRPRRRQ